MKKYLLITIGIAGGLAICVFAPLIWRLAGAFCIGGSCYALVEMLKIVRIQQEIERYDRPTVSKSAARRRRVVSPVREQNIETSFLHPQPFSK
jgi:hypothetical protein